LLAGIVDGIAVQIELADAAVDDVFATVLVAVSEMKTIRTEDLKGSLYRFVISETATNTVANTSSTAASASSDLNGYAVYNACQQLNERLHPYRKRCQMRR